VLPRRNAPQVGWCIVPVSQSLTGKPTDKDDSENQAILHYSIATKVVKNWHNASFTIQDGRVAPLAELRHNTRDLIRLNNKYTAGINHITPMTLPIITVDGLKLEI
jgi:hypothetical protein